MKQSKAIVGPVRVLRIIARLNIGGPAIHVALLTSGLNDSQFSSKLVAGHVGFAEGDMSYVAAEYGVEPVYVNGLGRELSIFSDMWAFISLVRLMLIERPHIVHTHTAKAGLLGRLAAYLCGVPIIVHTFHGHVFRGYFGSSKTRLFLWLERLAARFSTLIVTVSDLLRDELVRFGIAAPDKIAVVPLGLALDKLAAMKRNTGTFRLELGYDSTVRLIGIVGRLVPIKNHRLFLNAAHLLLVEEPNARFVIVGDGEERDALQEVAESLGILDYVRFVGWRQDLEAIYSDLDILVLTSINEGTPVSLIEAMAAGVPIVATSVGGVPDLLDKGTLGHLVEPGNARQLADAMMDVLRENIEVRTTMARQRSLEQHDAQRLIRDTRELYLKLLHDNGLVVS